MIIDQPSRVLWRTAIAGVLFLLGTGLSLTREALAQSPSAPGASTIGYRPESDSLDALFANGNVATIGDKTITVGDVRRAIQPLIAQLEKDSRDQADFNARLARLENETIRALIDRYLLIKEFSRHTDAAEEKHVASESVDAVVDEILKDQFDGDRSKFLAYLKSRAITLSQYRREVEEDIAFRYMKAQERKSVPPVKAPVAAGDLVHLRMLDLKRAPGETDVMLTERMNAILARLKNGESFATVATDADEGPRRAHGGDWGWQRREDMRAEFRDKIFALMPGEISEPIPTPEGWLLAFVEERK